MKTTLLILSLVLTSGASPHWGFFAHEKINRLAVFSLPPEMIGFYKVNIDYIGRSSVLPDKRRYAIEEEAPRHFLDVDHYSHSGIHRLPRTWTEAVSLFGEDSLKGHGILPWHAYHMYLRLRDAFFIRDPEAILKLSGELGHYVADAHVPLHTAVNYNGQLTGQEGIHGLWESRLPELFSEEYNFFVGKAEYLENPRQTIWDIVEGSHQLVGQVLSAEKKIGERLGEKKYTFETRGRTTVKVYAPEYARAYHDLLQGMVEMRMAGSVKMIANFWYTAWVEAGQPDLRNLAEHPPTVPELRENREKLSIMKEQRRVLRPHE